MHSLRGHRVDRLHSTGGGQVNFQTSWPDRLSSTVSCFFDSNMMDVIHQILTTGYLHGLYCFQYILNHIADRIEPVCYPVVRCSPPTMNNQTILESFYRYKAASSDHTTVPQFLTNTSFISLLLKALWRLAYLVRLQMILSPM